MTFRPQAITTWKRAVFKVGSSLLSGPRGLSTAHALAIGSTLAAFARAGREVVLVSSGAVAAGRALLARDAVDDALAARQALAAIGQSKVIELWQRFFDAPVAQVLLTHDDLRNRRRYLNARATLKELLRVGAVPVINENDTVAVDELKLGDNDNLAAHVALLIDADALFLLTDIAGLYDRDPRKHVDAKPVAKLRQIDPGVLAMAGGAGSAVGTGGMVTKLEAAARAADGGIATAIVDGTDAKVLAALAADRVIGTRVAAARTQLAARKAWLKNAPLAAGRIRVDAGAARALVERGASLLPRGVVGVDGEFVRGDSVEVARDDLGPALARGVAQYGAVEIRQLLGARGSEIAAKLGYSYGDEVVHRDDLVLLGSGGKKR